LRFAAVMLIASLLAGCDQGPSAGNGSVAKEEGAGASKLEAAGRLDRSHAGKPAPAVRFANPAGEPASLADFRGKPLLLNLWATWCAPCIVEMPGLDALAARDPGLTVLTLSQDMTGKETVDAFFAERKFKKLQPYLDAELSMMTALGVGTLPTTILYDAGGREVWRMTGAEDWTEPRAKALVGEALKP
jgi:thiol-disulfide isomerase/thioredoxin